MAIPLLILLALIFILTGIFFQTYRNIFNPPLHNPKDFLQQHEGIETKSILCIGDSLTQGQISANYVEKLRKQLDGNYALINGGRNGELCFNLLQRMDELKACKANYTILLIGTNDAVAALSPFYRSFIGRKMKLQQPPSAESFRDNLKQVIELIRKDSDTSLCVLSLPTISEDQSSDYYKQAVYYSGLIRETCLQEKVDYLPLNEKMDEWLQENSIHVPLNAKTWFGRMVQSIILRLVLQWDFMRISHFQKMELHTDILHLNDKGAAMITSLVLEFLQKKGALES